MIDTEGLSAEDRELYETLSDAFADEERTRKWWEFLRKIECAGLRVGAEMILEPYGTFLKLQFANWYIGTFSPQKMEWHRFRQYSYCILISAHEYGNECSDGIYDQLRMKEIKKKLEEMFRDMVLERWRECSMKAGKWNYETHSYEPYEVPEDAMLYSCDMEAECACARCGRKMKFGDGYASQEIHNSMGFGFSVCEDCSAEETGRKFQWENKEEK